MQLVSSQPQPCPLGLRPAFRAALMRDGLFHFLQALRTLASSRSLMPDHLPYHTLELRPRREPCGRSRCPQLLHGVWLSQEVPCRPPDRAPRGSPESIGRLAGGKSWGPAGREQRGERRSEPSRGGAPAHRAPKRHGLSSRRPSRTFHNPGPCFCTGGCSQGAQEERRGERRKELAQAAGEAGLRSRGQG